MTIKKLTENVAELSAEQDLMKEKLKLTLTTLEDITKALKIHTALLKDLHKRTAQL